MLISRFTFLKMSTRGSPFSKSVWVTAFVLKPKIGANSMFRIVFVSNLWYWTNLLPLLVILLLSPYVKIVSARRRLIFSFQFAI